MGVIFSWGKGSNGRLGHGKEENIQKPKKIKHLSKIVFFVSLIF